MSTPMHYSQNKKNFVDQLTEQRAALSEGAKSNSQPIVQRTLQFSAEAVDELLQYIESPIVDKALETFHNSDSERARAAVDLNKYLAEAGLMFPKNVRWELHDNNWCVDAQVSVHEGEQGATVLSVHYDSHSGWGYGVC